MSAGRKRHPIRGFFGGLFVGLGVALLLFLYGKIAFGTLTPYVIILAGAVLGIVWALVAPARRGRGGSDIAPPPPVPAAAPEPEPEPSPEPEPEPAATEPGPDSGLPIAATDTGGEWSATHIVPTAGLTTYAGSEEGGAENGRLDPGLEVQVIEQQGDWAKILCSNGWSAWVDARQLLPR